MHLPGTIIFLKDTNALDCVPEVYALILRPRPYPDQYDVVMSDPRGHTRFTSLYIRQDDPVITQC